MVAEIPDRLADLLELACYVYCADQFTRRDTARMRKMGAAWRRQFRFRIPVRDSTFWRRVDVRQALTEALSFLSEDDYHFNFVQSRASPSLEPYLHFPSAGPPAGFIPDRVVLFSGGLDSLTGAVEALVKRKEKVVLVSHQSSRMVQSKQLDLIQELRARTKPSQLFYVGVHVSKGGAEARDFTQRSRSFLFAALGCVVARLFGRSEISFFENGVVSLNLPISEHVIGARATRTTHPRVLANFGRLFCLLLEESVGVLNPYFWMTKADVVRRLDELGHADLIPKTFSCTRVREATRTGSHCGACSQCVDRRFAILAAGLERYEPAELYAIDLLLGPREAGQDLTMAESYVLTASKFARMTDAAFLARFGQVYRALLYLPGRPDQNAARLHQLHIRHGRGVMAVVNRESAAHASLESMAELPQSCLLRMIQSQSFRPPIMVDVTETEPPASEQAAKINSATVERPLRFGVDEARKAIVFQGGIQLKGPAYRLVFCLLNDFREDQAANQSPSAYRTVSAAELAERLGIEEATVRKHVSKARKLLDDQFHTVHGVPLLPGDVVENVRGGYRLSPHLVLVSTAVLNPPRHTSPSQTSQKSLPPPRKSGT
jgi:7-cyano-7-deazaguanine synthase in queuosine biosynthesis